MKFKIRKTSNDQYYLTIVARNGETLGHTENYTSKQSARHCAEVIMREAGGGSIDDLT